MPTATTNHRMNPALAKWVSQHAASELARVSAQPESAPLSLSAEQVTEAAQQLGLSEAQVRSELLAFDRALRAACLLYTSRCV